MKVGKEITVGSVQTAMQRPIPDLKKDGEAVAPSGVPEKLSLSDKQETPGKKLRVFGSFAYDNHEVFTFHCWVIRR